MNTDVPRIHLQRLVKGRVVGDGATVIERIADLESAGEAEIAYVESENFYRGRRAK